MLDNTNYYQARLISYSLEETMPTRLEWLPSLKRECRVLDCTKQRPIGLTNNMTMADYAKLDRR